MKGDKKKFALMGAAGFVAPRHFRAIKDTGNDLVAACDPFDSVGILDTFFPDALFFTEEKRMVMPIDFLAVCSPNYLHDAHIRLGLNLGADVICEKPLALDPKEVESLLLAQSQSGHKVYNILQLRLHPAIMALKKEVEEGPANKVYEVDLTYITSRGNWYYASWKADTRKSGGLATNIGVHFYDMLAWIFGAVRQNTVHISTPDRVAGFLAFERARVRYFLSIDYNLIPLEVKVAGKRTFRSLSMGGRYIEFSDGFTDLHTQSYREILAGRGFGLEEALKSIQIVHSIRNAIPIGLKGDYHPFAQND